ncbi:MAG: hypothetical protein R3D33_07320 [Hyphomicrobiaceae bacterium]
MHHTILTAAMAIAILAALPEVIDGFRGTMSEVGETLAEARGIFPDGPAVVSRENRGHLVTTVR